MRAKSRHMHARPECARVPGCARISSRPAARARAGGNPLISRWLGRGQGPLAAPPTP